MMDSKNGHYRTYKFRQPIRNDDARACRACLRTKRFQPKIQFYKQPVDDPLRRKPDISLAKDTLAWEPRTPLIDGLNETINYFKHLMR